MAVTDVKEKESYTYADVLSWDEDLRAELVGGELFMMSEPTTAHQAVLGEIFVQLHRFLRGKPCKVFPAPFGVRLFPKADNSDDTVLEPDIVVVCDRSKLDARGCKGAPDLIIEILSPSTALYDRNTKFKKYLAAGVREYWIVDPEFKQVQAFVLDNGRYVASVYDENDEAPVSVLPGCAINLADAFSYLGEP
ncbi:MAG: Uma2 family endonuclease [Spirochaetaceae bacterium]|jgi:Uma2 family endonuclease|nr:Uma2 family endonuclease [Spirochaetaceae bacterium]